MVNIYCSINVNICILSYLLNIDIAIAIFRQYRIDIVSKSKMWYRSITSVQSAARPPPQDHPRRTWKQLTVHLCGLSYPDFYIEWKMFFYTAIYLKFADIHNNNNNPTNTYLFIAYKQRKKQQQKIKEKQ